MEFLYNQTGIHSINDLIRAVKNEDINQEMITHNLSNDGLIEVFDYIKEHIESSTYAVILISHLNGIQSEIQDAVYDDHVSSDVYHVLERQFRSLVVDVFLTVI